MKNANSLRALRLALLCGLMAAGASSQRLAAQSPNPPFSVYEFFPSNRSTQIYTQDGFSTAIPNASYVGCAYGGDVHLTFDAAGLPEDLYVNENSYKLVIGQTHVPVLSFCALYWGRIFAIGSTSTTDGSNIYEWDARNNMSWTARQGIATGIDADGSALDLTNPCVTSNSSGDVWALSPSKGWVRIFTGSAAEKAMHIAVHSDTYYMVNSAGVVKTTTIPLDELPTYTGRGARKAVWTVDAQFAALGKPATYIAVSHSSASPVVVVSGSRPIPGNTERYVYVYVRRPNASGYTLLNSLVGPSEPSVSATCGGEAENMN